MSLTVIAGLPGSEAGEHALQRLTASERRTALLVVPSSSYAARMRSVLATTSAVGVRVVAISRLVESEWTLKGDGRRIVDELYRGILLSKALVAAGVSERPGTGAVALLGTLVRRVTAQGVAVDARLSGLSGRLLEAARAYLAALAAAGLVDPAEATRLLSTCAPPAEVIVFEGLTSFTPDRESLLRGWSGSGSEIVVSVPWQRGCAGTQPLDALVGRLVTAGATVEDGFPVADGRPAELERVAHHLFDGSEPAASDGLVRLGVVRGEESEARLIADRVTALLVGGVDASRIAVAFADPARHVGWLRRAFDDAEIEATWDSAVPVPETPMGRSMLRLWSCCLGSPTREDLAAFMRSPFSGVETDRTDRADVAWRTQRVQGRELLGLAGKARHFVTTCSAIAGHPVDGETAKKWQQLADDLLANAYGHDAPVPGMDGALDAAVHRSFCQALTAAAEGSAPITAAELWTAFSASSVSPASRQAPRTVTVTSLDGIRSRTFDAVIIGGLTAAETPKQGSDDRLEGDAVRGALRALDLAPETDEQARLERLAFYLAATAASRSLMLVRREADDEGRALRPSVFWDEFLDLYRRPGDAPEQSTGLPVTGFRLQDDAATGTAGACSLRGLLEDPASLGLLAAIDAVSPSEVERYTACPYAWFVERRLRPRTLDAEVDASVAGQAAHAALSSFYREWTADGVHRRVTPASVAEAVLMAGAAAKTAIAASPAPSTLDEEWLLASVEPAVQGLVERDARFLPEYAPTALEWSFGLGGDEPIDLGGVRIKGRADRIDTGPEGLVVIDYKRSRASSLAEIRRGGLLQLQLYAVAASRLLELPVAGALYRNLSSPSDRGFISSAVVGDFKANDVVDPSEITLLLEEAVDVARAAFEGMRAGVITPDPAPDRCAYCAALPFCPVGVRS